MRGLLKKDWYLLKKTCHVYFLVLVLFAVLGGLTGSETGSFYLLYTAILSGMCSMTLLSLDEKCKWQSWCQTLPVSRVQYVLAKYLVGALVLLALLAVVAVATLARQLGAGQPDIPGLLATLSVCLGLGLAAPALLLPFLFWLGTEKGRLAYYVLLGGVMVAYFSMPELPSQALAPHGAAGGLLVVGVALALFAASAALSAALYRRREL